MDRHDLFAPSNRRGYEPEHSAYLLCANVTVLVTNTHAPVSLITGTILPWINRCPVGLPFGCAGAADTGPGALVVGAAR
jgi:hypothetical protein